MSSVKNRILQFQQNEASDSPPIEFCTTGGAPTSNKYLSGTGSKIFNSSKDPTQNGIMSNNPKKTVMTINLTSNDGQVKTTGTNPKPPTPLNKPTGLCRPRIPSSPTPSAIPKLVSPLAGSCSGGGLPIKSYTGNQQSPNKLYSSMDWKEKYEEAEKKRLHIVSLAQKATRDYEELRRRYQDLSNENDKVVQRLNSSTNQLDALRKASEAAYHDYYKLKKHYQVENTAKSQALSRVDEYNKENRKLKRQSAALMQQVTEGGNFDLERLMEAGKGEEASDDDNETKFLRSRVQELESRVVNLESELERTKLAEFESQEAAMFVTDTAQSSIHELNALREKLRQSQIKNEKLSSTLNEVRLESESLRMKQGVGAEKLEFAEAELRKLQAEKNVLQRQSVVFFSTNTVDGQLQDALNQISDIQFQFEEQKLSYETQILELQEKMYEKESTYEAKTIEAEARIKSLESTVEELKERLEEEKLERNQENPPCIPPPPPPPPPPMMAPPPPPLPQSLDSSIQSVTLRRRKDPNSTASNGTNNGNGTPDPKTIIPNSSAQIDDVVSQIKRGIKLRSTEKTLNRKDTEAGDVKPAESIAIEEMRSILNNLKRTRRPN